MATFAHLTKGLVFQRQDGCTGFFGGAWGPKLRQNCSPFPLIRSAYALLTSLIGRG